MKLSLSNRSLHQNITAFLKLLFVSQFLMLLFSVSVSASAEAASLDSPEGSLSRDAEGSLSRDAEGSLLKDAEGSKVQASLSSEYQTIAPGQSFYVMLTQDIAPGWHTYWRNPGDSGAPTKLNWDLPAGFTASEIEWPYPERIAYGPLMNFGFSDQVVLLIKMTAPVDLAVDQVTLSAQGQWLVCAEICIPESGDVSLNLSVGQRAQDPGQAKKLMEAQQRIPADAGISASYQVAENELSLKIMLGEVMPSRITEVSYFPYEDGVMENPQPQKVDYFDGGLILSTQVGWDYSASSQFDGIVVIREDAGGELVSAFVIKPESASIIPGQESEEESVSLITAILFALLGGLILNLMPCVFPVLSIKILSLMQETEDLKGHGLVYTLGVVLSFLAIAGVLIALRQGGAEIGWGFQLQSPLVVGLLVYLFVLIGLNLSGFFEIGTSVMRLGQGGKQSGYIGSFSTGILATLVAAPCSAPFMATAVGFALTQSSVDALLIFGSLGLGMALPYLLLCYWPPLLKKLPRPGPWMIKMKELLAFPMYASAVWLLWVISIQAGSQGVLGISAGVLLLVFSIWLLRSLPKGSIGRYSVQLIALGVIVIAVALPSQLGGQSGGQGRLAQSNTDNATAQSHNSSDRQSHIEAVNADILPYSEALLAELRQQGPVFINFDAAWCITCKVNEAVALNREVVKQAFIEHNVAYLKGDWTNQDPAITHKLAEYQRSGVPLYLLYSGPTGRAEVLPQILTTDIILEAFGRVGD